MVSNRLMYWIDILDQCPLLINYFNRTLQTDGRINGRDERYIFVDVQIKEPGEISKRSELFNINKRVTTVDGYSRPFAFYSPQYPDGPIPGDVDYRRTLYWNPNVVTDSEGNAQVEFYNNSITNHFNISAAGITASGVPYILNENW